MRIVFAVTESSAEVLALVEALRGRFGCEVSLRLQGEGWYALAGVDVVVAMVDHYDPRAIREAEPGLVRVAWARDCFEHWVQQPGRQAFDLVLAPSVSAARFLSERMGKLARVFRGGAFEFGLHLGWVGRQAGDGEQRWPLVSFVVPLFNHLAQTQEMLSSLLASLPQGLDYEVILADDGSSDGTRAWLAQLREPRVRVLLNERNLGYARTNNVAVASARGEVLALVNNDLVFAPGWLEPMLEGLQDPRLRAAVVGNVQYRVADGALDHTGVELNASGQLMHVQTLPTADERFVPVLAVTGACMVLRRATFVAVGGFDEAYCNGGEDVDLCLRLRERGGRIYVATQSRIGHHVSLSRGKVTARDEANSRRLFRRWRSVLRQELSARWAERLQADPLSWRELGDEEGMTPSLLRLPPPAAAQEIAERLLRRQEARWEAMGIMEVGSTG